MEEINQTPITNPPIIDPPQLPKTNYKILFFLFLGLFLITLIIFAWFLINKNKPTQISQPQNQATGSIIIPSPTLIPTLIPTQIAIIPTKSATSSSVKSVTPKVTPDKVTLNFYQNYIKDDVGSKDYKNSPYLTANFINNQNQIRDEMDKSGGPGYDPIIFGQDTPDCGITADKPIINNNSTTVKLNMCYSGMTSKQPSIKVTLVLVNNEWKIDSATPNQ